MKNIIYIIRDYINNKSVCAFKKLNNTFIRYLKKQLINNMNENMIIKINLDNFILYTCCLLIKIKKYAYMEFVSGLNNYNRLKEDYRNCIRLLVNKFRIVLSDNIKKFVFVNLKLTWRKCRYINYIQNISKRIIKKIAFCRYFEICIINKIKDNNYIKLTQKTFRRVKEIKDVINKRNQKIKNILININDKIELDIKQKSFTKLYKNQVLNKNRIKALLNIKNLLERINKYTGFNKIKLYFDSLMKIDRLSSIVNKFSNKQIIKHYMNKFILFNKLYRFISITENIFRKSRFNKIIDSFYILKKYSYTRYENKKIFNKIYNILKKSSIEYSFNMIKMKISTDKRMIKFIHLLKTNLLFLRIKRDFFIKILNKHKFISFNNFLIILNNFNENFKLRIKQSFISNFKNNDKSIKLYLLDAKINRIFKIFCFKKIISNIYDDLNFKKGLNILYSIFHRNNNETMIECLNVIKYFISKLILIQRFIRKQIKEKQDKLITFINSRFDEFNSEFTNQFEDNKTTFHYSYYRLSSYNNKLEVFFNDLKMKILIKLFNELNNQIRQSQNINMIKNHTFEEEIDIIFN